MLWLLLLTIKSLSNPTELRFLVVGDYGSTYQKPVDFQNQKIVGKSMAALADLEQSDFVVSLGDNFYGSSNLSDHGVSSVNDEKFTYDWLNVYDGKRINDIPWYAVLGNHDWHQNPQPLLDYAKLNSRWVMDDFFYTRKMIVEDKKVVFVFCSLDLIYYGYDGFFDSGLAPDNVGATASNNNIRNNFRLHGWTAENDTINKQLNWIESTLRENSDASYLIVVGHYNMVTCDGTAPSLFPVQDLFNKYKVSAYIYGHSHQQAHAHRNSTFYLQSGTGGRVDSCRNPVPQKVGDWMPKDINYGFANVVLNASFASVYFLDKDMTVISVAGFRPRKLEYAQNPRRRY